MRLLLCLLPVIANAQITVNIQASKAPSNTFTKATGTSQNIITTHDEKLFNITDKALKTAVFTLVKRTPTNVYLRGPTPWKDLYTTYHWPEVKNVITPHNITVVDVKTSHVVLKRRVITNDDVVEKHQELTLTANIENKVSSSWDENESFAANVTCNIDVTGLGEVPKFKLNSSFGQNVFENKIVSVKSAFVKFDLKPKFTATVIFAAERVKKTFEVEYWIMLQGNVATNNEIKLNGHHFWAYDVKNVLTAATLPHMRKVKQTITVEFYSDDKIIVS